MTESGRPPGESPELVPSPVTTIKQKVDDTTSTVPSAVGVGQPGNVSDLESGLTTPAVSTSIVEAVGETGVTGNVSDLVSGLTSPVIPGTSTQPTDLGESSTTASTAQATGDGSAPPQQVTGSDGTILTPLPAGMSQPLPGEGLAFLVDQQAGV